MVLLAEKGLTLEAPPHIEHPNHLDSLTTTLRNDLFSNEYKAFLASVDPHFHHLFGRDPLIMISDICFVSKEARDEDLLNKSKQTLQTLISYQAKSTNIENGQEPGKIPHEVMLDNFEHLTEDRIVINEKGEEEVKKGWYLGKDGIMRNYDSVDSTPLFAVAMHKYLEASGDREFIEQNIDAVKAALNWVVRYVDKGFLKYALDPKRQHGGLAFQNWTDSKESLTQKDGSFPDYPIAPVEVQAFAWLALKVWADYFEDKEPDLTQKYRTLAEGLKERFNRDFRIFDNGNYYFAQALDGHQKVIPTITANPLLCLWASYKKDGRFESIVSDQYLNDVVARAFKPDIFVKGAGIRTMSKFSPTFNPGLDSYHNGSIWPWLNGAVAEGLYNLGYKREAQVLINASLDAFEKLGGTAYEVLTTNQTEDELYPYVRVNSEGNVDQSCQIQGWSTTALIKIIRLREMMERSRIFSFPGLFARL